MSLSHILSSRWHALQGNAFARTGSTKTAAKLLTLLDPRRLSSAMQSRGDDEGERNEPV